MQGDIWREISTLGFAEVSPFTRRVDEAQAAMNAAVDELLASIKGSPRSALSAPPGGQPSSGADSAAGRVLAQVAALRQMLHEQAG